MNVQQLIDALQKIEDKTMEIGFTYDGRAAGRNIHCVEIEQYLKPWREGDEKPRLMFREDTTSDYDYNNCSYSVEDYAVMKRAEIDNVPDWVCYGQNASEEERKKYWIKYLEDNISYYAKKKKRFDEEWKTTLLFLEGEK